jgi:hypothetical protein
MDLKESLYQSIQELGFNEEDLKKFYKDVYTLEKHHVTTILRHFKSQQENRKVGVKKTNKNSKYLVNLKGISFS